jgi:hypothetical protein
MHNIDMRVSLVVILLLATVASLAHAQEAASPPLDTFLEQRVAEELAADGILLSRLGVTLDVEQVGDKLLVSLVDMSTGRVSASTKIDEVPADRDAAVASVTVVVSNLTVQLGQQPPAATVEPAAPPVEPPAATVVDDDREREAAESAYREQAIGFGDEYVVTASDSWVSVSRRWTANQGELGAPLSGAEFYDLIDRPDLARAYHRRLTYKRVAIGAAAVGTMGAFALILTMPNPASCDLGDEACESANRQGFRNHMWEATGAIALSGVAIVIARYYWAHPHPISESEAKRLAAEHNQTLRDRLGLSVAPYVSGQGGGVSVAGRF